MCIIETIWAYFLNLVNTDTISIGVSILAIILAYRIGLKQVNISRRQIELSERQSKMDYIRCKLEQANILYERALVEWKDVYKCKELVVQILDEYFTFVSKHL